MRRGEAGDGFSLDQEEALRVWERNAERWPGVRPPWRPSLGDIESYRVLSGSKIRGKVLVLGSTPELRDLVARESSERPVVADASIAMLLRGASLLADAEPEREIWVKADWVAMPLPEASFDLVLGDMIWWVVPVSAQQGICRKIASLLRPDGVWVSRFRMHDALRLTQSPLDIIEEHLRMLSGASNDPSIVCGAMLSALYDATADMERRRLSRSRVLTALSGAMGHTHSAREQAFLESAAARIVGADWTIQGREEILRSVSERFKLLSEMKADDYESAHYPVLKLAQHEKPR